MSPVADALRQAMIEAYRPFVERRLVERGLEPPTGLSAAIDEGQSWLTDRLDSLLSLPYAEQPRGPLELFQEALRFPTGSLIEAGAAPVDRDDIAASALPGDAFDLAPASSSELGEEAWRAHLAWGAEKAAAVMGMGG